MKVLTLALAGALCLSAQAPDWKTMSGSAKAIQNGVKVNVVKSAEKMPEADYNFKPTPEVRSFAQLIGHIADANNAFCSASMGVANPNPGIEKGKTSKADLVAAIKAAIDFCDKAYEITEEQATQIIKFRNQDRMRIGVLQFNSYHTNLHYGNAITYLRLKGLVPPSTER